MVPANAGASRRLLRLFGIGHSAPARAGVPDAAGTAAPPESIDMASVAHLCTRLGCAQEAEELTAVLEEAG